MSLARTNTPETFGFEETLAKVESRSALFNNEADSDIKAGRVKEQMESRVYVPIYILPM